MADVMFPTSGHQRKGAVAGAYDFAKLRSLGHMKQLVFMQVSGKLVVTRKWQRKWLSLYQYPIICRSYK